MELFGYLCCISGSIIPVTPFAFPSSLARVMCLDQKEEGSRYVSLAGVTNYAFTQRFFSTLYT